MLSFHFCYRLYEQVVPEDQYGVASLCLLCHLSSHLDSQNRAMPCAQLLSFLQKNIIIAVVSVAGILGAMGLLLLALILHGRRKQPL